MEKTLGIVHGICNALDNEKAQEMMKPMFEQAYRDGLIKSAEEMEKFKTDFVLYLIATVPEFKKTLCEEVYAELKA
jgi:hypothetical protein